MSVAIGDYDAKIDLIIQQYADVSLAFSGILPDGTILDTTSYTAHAQVRSTPTSSVVLLDMTIANGRLAVGISGTPPNQWDLQLTLDHGTTALLTDWGIGVWDLLLIDAFDHRVRLMSGAAILSLGVTH